jgi:DNA-binding CsgD family transcriptional regulator
VLSERQLQVLAAAESGDSLARLASRLGMTRPAVGSHLSRIYQQLGVTHLPRAERRAAAVRVAVKRGLLTPEIRTS